MDALANFSIDEALGRLRQRYAAENPNSREAQTRAAAVLPGGNTRSVLHFDPFPLRMERGEGAEVWDIDGHRYLDCVGEFSAGLYGHSEPVIRAAIDEALERGTVLAAPTDLEIRLAEAITGRFPSIELMRFCNSGTEANLLALVTAMAVTGRKKILVFREAYHGGVLVFSGAGSPLNVPFDFVLADYNDADGASAVIRRHGEDLAAVIVEPILGAGGNIPGSREFLGTLRRESELCGALLIFDEVKTSRCGRGGMQGVRGIRPDLTTFGKYLGGGLPTGAFGGRRDIMARFDPTRPDAFRHAGTFNNNVCTMAAGLAGLTQVFTPERADGFQARCENLRGELNAAVAAADIPMRLTGLGSLMTVHFTRAEVQAPRDIPARSRSLGQLLHLDCLLNGMLVASRGDLFLSLPMTDEDFGRIRAVLLQFAESYAPLIRREIGAT